MSDFTQGTNDAASTLTGDQVIVEVQEILQADGFGLFQILARPSEQNGFTFTYKTPERLIPEAYDRSTNGALGKGAVVPQVDIVANIRDVVYFEIEDTEFASQTLAEAEKTRVANSIVQSMMAQLDAELLSMLKEKAAGTTTAVNFTKAAPSQDDLAVSRITLGDVVAENESIIDAKTLGVAAVRQMVILSPVAYWRYINSFDTNVINQSEEIKVGNLTIKRINGALIVKHPLIGKDHAVGVLHKTKKYELALDKAAGKALEGFVLTDIAAAIPFSLKKIVTRINKFGNEEIVSRYVFGKDAIRPGLIRMITAA